MLKKGRAIEFVVVAIAAGVIGLVAGTYEPLQRQRAVGLGLIGAHELDPLAQRYTTKRTRYGEEWIFRDFFNDQRGGFFLDVGSGPATLDSNTYFLETERGWRGIAIDALERYRADFAQHRPATRFFRFFVSNVSDASVRVHVPESAPGSASDNVAHAEAYQGEGSLSVIDQVPTITLNDLLQREQIDRLDLLVMDIELAEPRALAGFDVERYRPRLVCIESHAAVRQAILNYFHDHDYVVVGKYTRMDTQNLYFAPRSSFTD